MQTDQRLIAICLLILTAIACASVLTLTKSVLIPFTLSIFLYLIISPFMIWLQERFKLSSNITLVITVLLFCTSITLISLLVVQSLDRFIQDADQYNDRINSAIQQFAKWATEQGINLSSNELTSYFKSLPIGNSLKKISTSILNILSNSILITIFTLFLLAGESKSQNNAPVAIFAEIKKSISKYVNTKLLLSLITGLLIFIILLSFSVDLAFMFGLLTILLNFIPNLGSIIAVLLPVPVLMLQFGLGWKFIVVMILTSLVQLIIGNIIEPKLMGDHIGLHPVTILFFLAFWGFIWGIPGMFLSVPITAALKIILMKFDITKPVADLLAGQWSFSR